MFQPFFGVGKANAGAFGGAGRGKYAILAEKIKAVFGNIQPDNDRGLFVVADAVLEHIL